MPRDTDEVMRVVKEWEWRFGRDVMDKVIEERERIDHVDEVHIKCHFRGGKWSFRVSTVR